MDLTRISLKREQQLQTCERTGINRDLVPQVITLVFAFSKPTPERISCVHIAGEPLREPPFTSTHQSLFHREEAIA